MNSLENFLDFLDMPNVTNLDCKENMNGTLNNIQQELKLPSQKIKNCLFKKDYEINSNYILRILDNVKRTTYAILNEEKNLVHFPNMNK